ncbi:hypothetical protein Ddye_005001 [Dipteronia dyeriana]|uniref:Uncharacterized protein n=1 Tax=Dipteronia dyeriana TaxID=168575 RepID=A0AAE0CPU3_9ROSI|nr:hypothetical protein Ddye_005001 [Dipteronia dyeriana]
MEEPLSFQIFFCFLVWLCFVRMEHSCTHHLVSGALRSRPPSSLEARSEISMTALDREVIHLKDTMRVMDAMLDPLPQIQDDVVKLSAQMTSLGGLVILTNGG